MYSVCQNAIATTSALQAPASATICRMSRFHQHPQMSYRFAASTSRIAFQKSHVDRPCSSSSSLPDLRKTFTNTAECQRLGSRMPALTHVGALVAQRSRWLMSHRQRVCK